MFKKKTTTLKSKYRPSNNILHYELLPGCVSKALWSASCSSLGRATWLEESGEKNYCTIRAAVTSTFKSAQRLSNSEMNPCKLKVLVDFKASLDSWKAAIIDWNFNWQACKMSGFKELANTSNSGPQIAEQKAFAADTRDRKIAAGMNCCWNATWTESLGTVCPCRYHEKRMRKSQNRRVEEIAK